MNLPAIAPVRVALLGAGRMGAFHATSLARRIPDADLIAVCSPLPTSTPSSSWPPAWFHADLVTAAATAGTRI